jgi:hypothetical protein
MVAIRIASITIDILNPETSIEFNCENMLRDISTSVAGTSGIGYRQEAVRLEVGDPQLVCGPCVPPVDSSAPPHC